MDLYHVLNRGVDKRQVFMDDKDRVRFVHDLYVFNDTAPAGNSYKEFQNMDVRRPYFEADKFVQNIEGRVRKKNEKRDLLVYIHAWVLLDNHYHLLLSPVKENGLSEFLKKLNGGYSKYFNERYERCGALWQGKTKKILVENDAHFLHILNYIHFNPLDMNRDTKKWREYNINNYKKALESLDLYRWSSYLDYCNQKNFPSIIYKDLFSSVFNDYKESARQYLKDIDMTEIKHLTLE